MTPSVKVDSELICTALHIGWRATDMHPGRHGEGWVELRGVVDGMSLLLTWIDPTANKEAIDDLLTLWLVCNERAHMAWKDEQSQGGKWNSY